MTTLHFNALVPPFDLGEGTATEVLEKGNVLTYGADSTGVEASDKAFKEALEESKTVYFPPGTYLLNEEHKIEGNYEIYGAGEQLSTLKTTRTPNAAILTFEKKSAGLHDLRIVAPLTGVTEGALVTFKEAVYGENNQVAYRVSNVETVGGWIQLSFITLGNASVKNWRGYKPQKYALYIEGTGANKCQLVQVTDSTIEMPETSAAESACIRVLDAEAMQLVHVNTEKGFYGLQMTGATKNSHITDTYFDNAQGTGCLLEEGGEGIYFNKTWFQCFGSGGGAKILAGAGSVPEDIFFDGCQFLNSTGENSAFWTQMTKTAYEALAAENKRGAWKAATEYKIGQGVESHEGFQEAAKTMTAGEDVEPKPGATGLTIGENAKFVCVTASSILNSGLHGIKIEKGAQKIMVANNLIEGNFGYGVKIGKEVAKSQISSNNLEGNEFGAVKNEASEIATNFVVFNTGFSEFLTSTMSKPAEQLVLLEGAQNKPPFGAQVRTQIISYKTKADTETKVKHNLNSTAVLSVVAYKYPASKFESKMQLAAKTVTSFTVNTANEITIKWSETLGLKEEIAIIIQAA